MKSCLTNPSNEARFYCPDLFHIVHAGLGKDVVASGLVYCTKVLYRGRGVQAKLDLMNVELKQWLKNMKGTYLHCSELTLDLLGYESTASFPFGHWSKGADTVVLMRFMLHILEVPARSEQVARDPILEHLLQACKSMGALMGVLFGAGYFVQGQQSADAVSAATSFIESYRLLVLSAHRENLCLFALKPKTHMFHHLVMEIQDQHTRQGMFESPLSQSTFQSEDFVGRVSRLSRRVAPMQVARKTLYRYLTCAACELQNEEITATNNTWRALCPPPRSPAGR